MKAIVLFVLYTTYTWSVYERKVKSFSLAYNRRESWDKRIPASVRVPTFHSKRAQQMIFLYYILF